MTIGTKGGATALTKKKREVFKKGSSEQRTTRRDPSETRNNAKRQRKKEKRNTGETKTTAEKHECLLLSLTLSSFPSPRTSGADSLRNLKQNKNTKSLDALCPRVCVYNRETGKKKVETELREFAFCDALPYRLASPWSQREREAYFLTSRTPF